MFNSDNYKAAVTAFVKAGKTADNSANAFAPHAFMGLIENQCTIDTITADMCAAGNYRSAKGKLLATALPVAVKKALGQVKRAWTNCALDNGIGHDVRLAVHSFIGLMSEEEMQAFDDDFALICEAKGWLEPTEAQRSRAMSAHLDVIYPARPKSFAALNKAVDKAIAQAKADDKANDDDNEGDEGNEGNEEPSPSPSPVLDVEAMAAVINAADVEVINALPNGFAALLDAISNALARAQAVQVKQAA